MYVLCASLCAVCLIVCIIVISTSKSKMVKHGVAPFCLKCVFVCVCERQWRPANYVTVAPEIL